MSVRAYRVNANWRDTVSSFNLTHHQAIMDWLEHKTEFLDCLNIDACGLTEVSVPDLKRMVKKLAKKVDANAIAKIKDDITYAEAQGRDWVEYYCR